MLNVPSVCLSDGLILPVLTMFGKSDACKRYHYDFNAMLKLRITRLPDGVAPFIDLTAYPGS